MATDLEGARAYALKAEFEPLEGFGGSFALVVDGTTYDVAAKLREGHGVLIEEDERVFTQLDNYPSLKRVSGPVAEEIRKANAPRRPQRAEPGSQPPSEKKDGGS